MVWGIATDGTPDRATSGIVVNGRFLDQRATGVQRVAREIVCALDRLLADGGLPRLRVRLVAPGGTQPAFEALGCRHVAFEEAPGLRGHAWEQLVLPRHVRGGRLLCLGNSAPLLNLFSARPPAVMLHDQAHRLFPEDYSPGYRLIHRVIEAAIIRGAAPLLLVSEAERGQLARTHATEAARAVVVPNGSVAGDAAPEPAAGATAAGIGYGLFIGRLAARKNVERAFAVALRLAREERCGFRFAGPGMAALSERIPSELRARVQAIGYVDDASLPGLYRGARFLLYPSLYEASGLPPSEAMAFGCPVIASDLPVLRERCGDAALYCDPASEASIHAAAVRLLGDPALADRLRRQGCARAAATTWRNQARAIVAAMLAANTPPVARSARRLVPLAIPAPVAT